MSHSKIFEFVTFITRCHPIDLKNANHTKFFLWMKEATCFWDFFFLLLCYRLRFCVCVNVRVRLLNENILMRNFPRASAFRLHMGNGIGSPLPKFNNNLQKKYRRCVHLKKEKKTQKYLWNVSNEISKISNVAECFPLSTRFLILCVCRLSIARHNWQSLCVRVIFATTQTISVWFSSARSKR